MTDDSGFVADEPPAGVDRPRLDGPEPAKVFGVLFDAYARPLHRYLARRVGQETANDLVSETFLVALRERYQYEPARATVRSWLYGIATNLLRRHVRQEVRGLHAAARAVGTVERHDPGDQSRVVERVDAAVTARRLAGALAALFDGDRDVLLLASWAEMDSVEIAEALGIPVGTVRSRLHRVRRQLQAQLSAPGGHSEPTQARKED
ncbi:RNA polymerase sigma factor [Micromonospora deserti]|uniref:RNA polymerase subunit sigma-70 n=1 Tax=Micromonospora deserti TaxID=2070366 RepID=A0A2W2DT23_9ACTN|nr:RNA polymerase sigma factor [Micromonospora deserti]PZG02888.1 RNA polymerase subunit sigma-70 [Micromonospora deserti]